MTTGLCGRMGDIEPQVSENKLIPGGFFSCDFLNTVKMHVFVSYFANIQYQILFKSSTYPRKLGLKDKKMMSFNKHFF